MLLFLILKRFCALRGLKETSRIGITSANNKHYSIQYDQGSAQLKGHHDNKMIWVTPEHKFYFTDEPGFFLNYVTGNTELLDNRSRGVYDANTKELLSYDKSVKECELK